ncbi:MAG: outer membrane protein assembly factor BamA [Thermoanaerobaculia bacterium]
MSWTCRLLLLALGLTLALFLGADVVRAQEGSPVSRIIIRADTVLDDVEQLVDYLAVEVGEPYSLDAVSRSIRNLQASGRTGQIEAFAQSTPEGVEVTFALWANFRVESVQLAGDLGIKRRDLMAEVEVRPRSPLIESQILRDFYRLGDRLAVEGFMAARVTPEVDIDEERKLANVTYRIESGPPFSVDGIDFEGDLGPFDPSALMEPLRSSPGKRFFSRRPAEDAERLEGWLIDQGYRQAIVTAAEVTTDWEAAKVRVRYGIELGPHFEIEILGGDPRRLEKRGLLPFLEQQRFDEALLLQSVERIRSFYQQQGHYQVEIKTSQEQSGDTVHVSLVIDPGSTYRLAEIVLTGNEYFSDRQLTPLMETSTRRGVGSGGGRLVDTVLVDDLANIEAFYALNGYDQAVVGPHDVEIEEQNLYVGVPIEEGRQRRVVELNLAGATQLPEEQLIAGLPLSSGGPFHQALLNETVTQIRSRYEAEGYESTQISPLLEWNEDETRVDVTLRVLEGPRSVVDRIIVRGANRTNSRVVRYAMRLESGEHFNTSRLLEVQRNLYRLGTFSRVEVRRAPGTPFRGERDILVHLEEGKRRKLTYGFGFDSEDGLRGLFGYSMSNLLGRALTARVDVRASNRDNLARFLLTQPYFFHLHYPSTVSLFYIEEVKDSFTSRRRGGQFEIRRQGTFSRVNLLLDYRNVEVLDAVDALGDLEIDRDLQEVQIASITPAWSLDHRNDEFDPNEGWNTILQVEYAFPFAQAETEFLKAFVQVAGYLDFGRIGVLAGSFRVGAIEPLNEAVIDSVLPPDLPSRYIPISERFFAGGRTTHRAYKRDRLGIPGETLIADPDAPPDDELDASSLAAVGGNGLLIANLEYRFPIAGPIGGTLFGDFGNLWADWRSINVAEGKPGIGTGIRYSSPIGPIRVEVGYKLDPLPGEDDWVLLFSVGNAF